MNVKAWKLTLVNANNFICRFACFLLLLVPSLGEVLQHEGINVRDIAHRPAVSFYQAAQLQELFPGK